MPTNFEFAVQETVSSYCAGCSAADCEWQQQVFWWHHQTGAITFGFRHYRPWSPDGRVMAEENLSWSYQEFWHEDGEIRIVDLCIVTLLNQSRQKVHESCNKWSACMIATSQLTKWSQQDWSILYFVPISSRIPYCILYPVSPIRCLSVGLRRILIWWSVLPVYYFVFLQKDYYGIIRLLLNHYRSD